MLNYRKFLKQEREDREGVFIDAAIRLGSSANNVEKDFWICVLLDAVFMEGPKRWPQLVFRGGTSLSKAHNAIKRFSEDIDLALSRSELGIKDTLNSLYTMKEPDRSLRLEEIDAAARKFVETKMIPHLNKYLDNLFKDVSSDERPTITTDYDDPLTLLMPYQSITRGEGGYVPTRVRLEFSIKSATTPHTLRSFSPYISKIVPNSKMELMRVPTISVARTFWDKMMIAHELKNRHNTGLELTINNERVSRHYYDLYTLIESNRISINKSQSKMAQNCQKHSATFYPDPSIDMSEALPGTFDVVPNEEMIRVLERDYNEMSVMLFDDQPNWQDIQRALSDFEHRINRFCDRDSKR